MLVTVRGRLSGLLTAVRISNVASFSLRPFVRAVSLPVLRLTVFHGLNLF